MAFSRQSSGQMGTARFSNCSIASRIEAGVCWSKKQPVGRSAPSPRTVSRAPPRPNAITGVPQACASSGAIPKSSFAAKTKARALRISSRISPSVLRPRKRMLDPWRARSFNPDSSGPSPATTSSLSGLFRNASTSRSIRLYCTMREQVK